jgi:hypothetical protein
MMSDSMDESLIRRLRQNLRTNGSFLRKRTPGASGGASGGAGNGTGGEAGSGAEETEVSVDARRGDAIAFMMEFFSSIRNEEERRRIWDIFCSVFRYRGADVRAYFMNMMLDAGLGRYVTDNGERINGWNLQDVIFNAIDVIEGDRAVVEFFTEGNYGAAFDGYRIFEGTRGNQSLEKGVSDFIRKTRQSNETEARAERHQKYLREFNAENKKKMKENIEGVTDNSFRAVIIACSPVFAVLILLFEKAIGKDISKELAEITVGALGCASEEFRRCSERIEKSMEENKKVKKNDERLAVEILMREGESKEKAESTIGASRSTAIRESMGLGKSPNYPSKRQSTSNLDTHTL